MDRHNINWRKSVIILSGGFDPIHKGHMRMFREAANLGHQVVLLSLMIQMILLIL